jgi:hypothetical protein
MKKTILTFGFIAGAVSVGILLLTTHSLDAMDFRTEDILGYTAIALSSLLVFFGIRSYRETAGGRLTFGRGFGVGVAITLVSSLIYVVAFQIIYFKLMPGIGEKYVACMVQRAKVSGATGKELDQAVRTAQNFKQMFDRPAMNAALTFAESFPVGFVISGISAAILRRKNGSFAGNAG